MSFTKVVILLASALYCSVNSVAVTTHGKDFVFAFFSETTSEPTDNLVNDVYISSLSDTDCTLSYNDGVRKQIHIHIPAERVARNQFSDNTQMSVGTKVENKGIYVNCTKNVWMYAYNRLPMYTDSSDSYTILPIKMLATEYLVPSINNNPLIGIVAISQSTVEVHLKSKCKIQYKNNTYQDGDLMTFKLNTNDVVQIVHSPFKYHTDYDCDFSGTLIKSSSPTAVFSGSVFYYANQKVGSHLMLQVPQLGAYSTFTIVPKIPSPATEANIRVLASHDNTSVSILSQTGYVMSPIILKNRGNIFDYNYTASTDLIVHSDKPVMIVQNTFFLPEDGDLSMFIPGTNHYDKEYVLQSFSHDFYSSHQDVPVLTIVSETLEINNININGMTPTSMQWTRLNGTKYSVGTRTITEAHKYHINSTSPILVRLHLFIGRETYGFIGGYKLPNLTETVKTSAHLQCLQDSWLVTVNIGQLSFRSKDIPNIYLGVIPCTGTLQGQLLTFNVSYDQCHTTETTVGGNIVFKNSVWYAPLSPDNVIRNVQWVLDVSCTHPLHGTDSVHIYPKHNTTSHVTISGQIEGTPVHISLFKDSSFHTPFTETKDKAQIGQPIYVQVSAPGSHSLVMLVNSCHAHLTNGPGNFISHPLISNGCPVDTKTQILASRNQVTRFMFDMFTLPREEDGIYVTCDVTFCSTMDFSPHCQLGCHTGQNPGIVGK